MPTLYKFGGHKTDESSVFILRSPVTKIIILDLSRTTTPSWNRTLSTGLIGETVMPTLIFI